ncbi:hypothetical protein BDV96DRAFT_570264 [Lophiotrema nucula]|uniref:Uncharacterized protein n=1 Tax=Lophiotrema nucula TaxID=690887 RepID=A0A6A5ZJJ5_9PLEO|nr:hypothetical protein BDV96DRAFT_570264 [Lophiotrema nucula]
MSLIYRDPYCTTSSISRRRSNIYSSRIKERTMSAENLYIVKRTQFDPKSPREPVYTVTLPATFTNLKSAKEFASRLLEREGYDPDFFAVYAVNDDPADWTHGDGVVVYAEGPEKEVFTVEIETTQNTLALGVDDVNPEGRVQRQLYHVLQTMIEYNEDRSGGKRYAVVEATLKSHKDAMERALNVLLDGKEVTKDDFAEYDEFKNGEGPFGSDAVVHAVKEGGQNILTSVVAGNKLWRSGGVAFFPQSDA